MGSMMLTVLASASEAASEVAKAGTDAAGGAGLGAVLLAILVALLTSSVVANIVSAVMTSLRASAENRRQHYAAAVELLAARVEYHYRIRRRTSNDPETLTKLADAGHDLQQRLAQSRSWVAGENAVLGEVFDSCIAVLVQPFKDACREAWAADPVTDPAQMNLNGFGMGNQGHVLDSMQCALVYRFGWRRLISNRALKQLLTRKGCFPARAQANTGQLAQSSAPDSDAEGIDT